MKTLQKSFTPYQEAVDHYIVMRGILGFRQIAAGKSYCPRLPLVHAPFYKLVIYEKHGLYGFQNPADGKLYDYYQKDANAKHPERTRARLEEKGGRCAQLLVVRQPESNEFRTDN